ncbi:hypothetical protein [Actinoplanes sp. NPDC020271]|uniref:hypothetical protein n=1 Tax=Actinoplanes sp. NPDC020271 TaxID=3363896 RepID=UPI0037993EB4
MTETLSNGTAHVRATIERHLSPLLPPPAGGAHEPNRDRRGSWSPARWAYSFYAVAATGAVIGQSWVALDHMPWPASMPVWTRVLLVLPFAICLELLAMVLAAMADERMRLGEHAYGFRAFSALVAIVAVGIQVAGHWPDLYWSSVFGLLSSSAYLLWLLHAAARRRDALRASGKLRDTAPDYGLWRRIRHPIWTARAAELAREGHTDDTGQWRPLKLYESLRAAELMLGDEKRRPAIAHAVKKVVQTDQRDPYMADVAVSTLDLDRLAEELVARVDYQSWADRLAPAITPPPAPSTDTSKPDTSAPAAAPPLEQPESPEGKDDALNEADNPDSHREPETGNPDPPDDEEEEGADEDEPDGNAELSDDLVPLLPAARAARDQLVAAERSVSRDALAQQMRGNGHAIRNNRVSELLNALRREAETSRDDRPKVPA